MKTVYQLTMTVEGREPVVSIFESLEAVEYVSNALKEKAQRNTTCIIQPLEYLTLEDAIQTVSGATNRAALYNSVNSSQN